MLFASFVIAQSNSRHAHDHLFNVPNTWYIPLSQYTKGQYQRSIHEGLSRTRVEQYLTCELPFNSPISCFEIGDQAITHSCCCVCKRMSVFVHATWGGLTCRSNAQHGFFFGTEILGTMPTLGDSHSSNFACNIVSNGSNHAPQFATIHRERSFQHRKCFPRPIGGCTAPNCGQQFATIHREHCFRHRKRFRCRFWVRTPAVRCAPYLGTIIQ